MEVVEVKVLCGVVVVRGVSSRIIVELVVEAVVVTVELDVSVVDCTVPLFDCALVIVRLVTDWPLVDETLCPDVVCPVVEVSGVVCEALDVDCPLEVRAVVGVLDCCAVVDAVLRAVVACEVSKACAMTLLEEVVLKALSSEDKADVKLCDEAQLSANSSCASIEL